MEIDWLITLDYIGKNLAFENAFVLELALQPGLPQSSTTRSFVLINLKNYITLSKEIELQDSIKDGEPALIYGRDITYELWPVTSILAYLEYQTKTGAQVAFMTEDLYELNVFTENIWYLHQFAASADPLVLQILINFESKFRECIALYTLLQGQMNFYPVNVYIYLLGLAEFRAAGLREISTDVYPYFTKKQTDELNVGLFFDPAELQKYFTGEKFKLLDLSDVNEVLKNLRPLIDFIGIQSTNLMIL